MRTNLTIEQHRFESIVLAMTANALRKNGFECMAHAKWLQAMWHERRAAERLWPIRYGEINTGESK